MSTARKAIFEPSRDQAKPVTGSLELVSCAASPPLMGRTHTCALTSVPEPRDEMNAIDRPSGDHAGLDSPRSPNVSCRGAPPLALTSQMCERMSCLSPLAVSGAVHGAYAR